ncbi:MAG: hypothetical protein R3B13_40910 [Polyangiaceae bacterium]
MDRYSSTVSGLVCVALTCAVACSGTSGGGGSGSGAGGAAGGGGFSLGGSPSGGVAGSGAAGGSGGTASTGGSGGGAAVPTYVSNTPGASVSEVPTAEVSGLTVVSSNLMSKPSGSQHYQQWIGLLYNGTSKVICYGKVSAKFFDGSGSEVGTHLAFADTPPHQLPSSALTASCLQPGTLGGLYSNGFFNAPLTPSNVATISFEIDGMPYDAVPLHPAAPTFSAVTLTELYGPGSGYWGATGTLTATSTIYNIGIEIYPVAADGLVPDRLGDAHLGTLSAGSSYSFETTTYQGAPALAQMLSFSDFLEGTSTFDVGSSATPQPDTMEDLQALATKATSLEARHAARASARRFHDGVRARFLAARTAAPPAARTAAPPAAR